MDNGIAQFLYSHTFHSNHWESLRLGIPIFITVSHHYIIPATSGVKEEIYHDQK